MGSEASDMEGHRPNPDSAPHKGKATASGTGPGPNVDELVAMVLKGVKDDPEFQEWTRSRRVPPNTSGLLQLTKAQLEQSFHHTGLHLTSGSISGDRSVYPSHISTNCSLGAACSQCQLDKFSNGGRTASFELEPKKETDPSPSQRSPTDSSVGDSHQPHSPTDSAPPASAPQDDLHRQNCQCYRNVDERDPSPGDPSPGYPGQAKTSNDMPLPKDPDLEPGVDSTHIQLHLHRENPPEDWERWRHARRYLRKNLTTIDRIIAYGAMFLIFVIFTVMIALFRTVAKGDKVEGRTILLICVILLTVLSGVTATALRKNFAEVILVLSTVLVFGILLHQVMDVLVSATDQTLTSKGLLASTGPPLQMGQPGQPQVRHHG